MKRPITPKGYSHLRKELTRLKALRPELAKAIEIARGHGDLSENGDYDAAKERSGMIEAKIRDLEVKLTHADVIDPRKLGEVTKVVFGVSVKLLDLDSEQEKNITLVGPDEPDIDRGLISIESPFAKALIGKEEGDVAKVSAPGGAKEFEIISIFVEAEKFIVSEDDI